MMNEFKTFHPFVNLIYFVLVIGFCMFCMHPVMLIIALVSSFLYSVVQNGKKTIKTNILFILPITFLMAIVNPLFNHRGVTILAYFPNLNPLTLESIIYGILSAFMIFSVICYFSCCNNVMTSDKFTYLFGKIIPALALVFSMTLRFIPEFSQKLKQVAVAQKNFNDTQKNIVDKLKNALNILSITVTWALESAVETSNSMQCRGYGLAGRKNYSVFKITTRDYWTICSMLVLGVYVFIGVITKTVYFNPYPRIIINSVNGFTLSIYTAYFILCNVPVIIEIKEDMKWKYLKSKI